MSGFGRGWESLDCEGSLLFEIRVCSADEEVIWRLIRRHLRHDDVAEFPVAVIKFAAVPDLLQRAGKQAVPRAVLRELIVHTTRYEQHTRLHLGLLGGRVCV